MEGRTNFPAGHNYDGSHKCIVECQGYMGGVIAKVTEPPSSPPDWSVYLVVAPATGKFAGKEDQLAYWAADKWHYVIPQDGCLIWCRATNEQWMFDGVIWGLYISSCAVVTAERFSKANLVNDETWAITHSSDISFKRIIQVFHDKLVTDITWDFDKVDEGLYTQEDNAKTSFEGDSLHLKGLSPAAYAQWHLNELTGAVASDSSGNGRDGTLINMEDADWVPGKLNNCLRFNESGTTDEYVDCGNVADFELSDKFSFEFWIKILAWNAGNIRVLWKYDGTRGYLIYIGANRIYVFFRDKVLGGDLWLHGSTPINLGDWYHVVVTYDGSGLASGVEIYVNGSKDTKTVLTDTIAGGTIATNASLKLSSSGASYFLDGYLDEVLVYDVEVSQAQVTFRWNDGAGTEIAGFPIGNWYVHTNVNQLDTSGWDAIKSIAFTQIEPANTQLRYLLSIDNRVTWKRWNGAAWVNEVLANIHTNGNTKAELEILTEANWALLFSAGTFNIAIGLKTTSAIVTPDLDLITINYSLPGKYKCKETQIDIILDSATKTLIKNISGRVLEDLGAVIMT